MNKLILSAVFAAAVSPAKAVTQVYFTNFESGVLGTEWSGAGSVTTTGGLSAFGFETLHLMNGGTQSTLLTLIGLAPHTGVTLSFDLAMWDSIDLGGDQFEVFGGGISLYESSTDFGNYSPPDNVSHGPGTLLTAAFTAFDQPQYGQSTTFRDSARTVTFTFPHTGPDLVFDWQFPNSQGSPDESFGLDNVRVTILEIPEPSASLLGLAALTAGLRIRRRTKM